jgi:uncharacterized membrane protein
MRARRGLAGLVAAASVVAGGAALPSAAVAGGVAEVGAPCVREMLPIPAGSWQRITVVDAEPGGRFQIGYGTDTSWRGHLVRWDNGVPADLGTPPGSLAEVNAQGTVVGTTTSEVAPYHSTAWRYADGQVTTLPGLPGSVQSIAEAIAPDGTVAGYVRAADGQRTAVTWAPDNTVQALPGTGESRAVDIDADGTVIGYLGEAPVRWAPGGQAEILPAYAPGPGTSWRLTGITGGRVLGEEQGPDDVRVVVWAPGAAPVSLGRGAAHAVNAAGSVAYERIYENEQWLRQGGVDRALPFGPSPYSVADVVAVTSDDTVYGTHYSTPVRWVCA